MRIISSTFPSYLRNIIVLLQENWNKVKFDFAEKKEKELRDSGVPGRNLFHLRIIDDQIPQKIVDLSAEEKLNKLYEKVLGDLTLERLHPGIGKAIVDYYKVRGKFFEIADS